MFTGIVTDVGSISTIEVLEKGKSFTVKSVYDTDTIDIGASIAHDGVCLTVTEKESDGFKVEAWEEALRLTTLGHKSAGDPVNLERSLKMGDEIGGHLVLGHVDGVAKVVNIFDEGDAIRFLMEAPLEYARFIAEKGSIALNGTSLTVNQVTDCQFDVLLIRHTLEVTTWGNIKKNDYVNLEVDMMARYTARLAEYQ